METAKQNRFEKNKGQWDTINSTYMHKIYTNQGKCKMLQGYSCGYGDDEIKDKEKLIQQVILRLLNCGYLDRSDKIEFYKKNFLNSKQSKLILVLKPKTYQFAEGYDFLIPFLEKVYDCLENKKKIEKEYFVKVNKEFAAYDLDIEVFKGFCVTTIDFADKLADLKAEGRIPYKILTTFWKIYNSRFINPAHEE